MGFFPPNIEVQSKGRHFGAWVNPDGSQGQRIYSRPVHRLVAGEWVQMDNQMLAPWKFQVDGKVLDFSLGKLQAKTEGGLVRDLSLADTATASGSAEKMTAYPYPGVEIEHEVGLAGVKETIRISSLPKLPGGAFKSKWISISGSIAGMGALQRKEASFTDALGKNGPGYLIWDGEAFELGVDVAWLYGAALPVLIDPTINTEGNDVSLYTDLDPWPQYRKCFVKYDVTSIPDAANITAATNNLYCTIKGSANKSLISKRFNSQTWTEASTVAVLDAIAMGGNLDSDTESSLTLNAYNGFVVRKGDNTDGIEADVSGGNQYFTGGLWYSDTQPIIFKDNTTRLKCGTDGVGGATHSEFHSAEGTSVPYLDVTYTVGGGGGDPGGGHPGGGGGWGAGGKKGGKNKAIGGGSTAKWQMGDWNGGWDAF